MDVLFESERSRGKKDGLSGSGRSFKKWTPQKIKAESQLGETFTVEVDCLNYESGRPKGLKWTVQGLKMDGKRDGSGCSWG